MTMQDRPRSSSWDEDFPDDERLTDEMAAGSKPNEGEANAGKPIVLNSQAENGEKAPEKEKEEPALVEDNSGDVKPASNSSAAETMAEPIQVVQTDSKKEADDSQGHTKSLFKMWTHKSIKGLDSSHTNPPSEKPAPGVPRKSWSPQTAKTAEEEPSPVATGATGVPGTAAPPKPGSLVVNGLEAKLGEELQQLLKDINRCGEKGEPSVEFGVLFDDPEVEQYYEALVGTLKNAKKRGLISFEGQMLLKGVHDKVVVSIVKP